MKFHQRIPNQLKFSAVLSDKSKLEGTLPCSDEQWAAIWKILMSKPTKTESPK